MSDELESLRSDLKDLGFKKSNCYSCKHRGEIAGSAHSKCNLLTGGPAPDSALAVFASAIALGNVTIKGVKINPHGFNNGWANWPLDFDPIWISECTFHSQIEK